MFVVPLMALMATIAPGAMQAQEVLTAAPAAETIGENWNVVSRSSSTVYMVNVGAIQQSNGITTAYVARVPAQGEAGDLTHSRTEVQFRCNARQSRSGTEIYYAADGSEEERIPNEYEFEAIAANSLDAYVQALVCEGERSNKSFESISAFVAAGRPGS